MLQGALGGGRPPLTARTGACGEFAGTQPGWDRAGMQPGTMSLWFWLKNRGRWWRPETPERP